jgi:NADH dehydrogenase FAD-containing subunit
MTQQLVLLGSGPAHLRLLARLAKQLPPGATTGIKITLISRNQRPIDSALSREFVAGRTKLDDCLIDLEPLVQKTKAQWLEVQAVALDARAQALLLADGQEIRYDWLSINQEPVQERERTELQLPGACANGLFVRPASVFCKLWPNVLELAATKALRVAVVCDNASTPQQEIVGIELAMAIHQALPHCAMTLITGGAPLASASSTSMRHLLAKTLQAKKITVLADAAMAIKPGEIILASGASLACDVPVLATHTHPPAMAAASALGLDANGFVAVDSALRSLSHSNVFEVPDSDLHGDVLAQTLAHATGLPFSSPSDRGTRRGDGVRLISCSDGRAIASWGSHSASGRLIEWLKQRVDQSRMASYRA